MPRTPERVGSAPGAKGGTEMSRAGDLNGAPTPGWIIGYRGTCYPADCDHMGHMNVAAYVKKFDEGTWLLWDAVGLSAHRMAETKRGLAALKSTVEYVREVFPGEALTVRSAIVEVGAKTARFRHVMSVAKQGGPVEAARCEYLVCYLDREGHKGEAWPEDLRAGLHEWCKAADDQDVEPKE